MEPHARPGWTVERVQPFRARKDYVCPGCSGTIAAGEGHVVAWPEPFLDDRRHWHHHCWRDEVRHAAGGGGPRDLG